jgi:hypothetical protein
MVMRIGRSRFDGTIRQGAAPEPRLADTAPTVISQDQLADIAGGAQARRPYFMDPTRFPRPTPLHAVGPSR